ncbi:hypothetical protein PRNP1_001512 [Phytophthora ramorum]
MGWRRQDKKRSETSRSVVLGASVEGSELLRSWAGARNAARRAADRSASRRQPSDGRWRASSSAQKEAGARERQGPERAIAGDNATGGSGPESKVKWLGAFSNARADWASEVEAIRLDGK